MEAWPIPMAELEVNGGSPIVREGHLGKQKFKVLTRKYCLWAVAGLFEYGSYYIIHCPPSSTVFTEVSKASEREREWEGGEQDMGNSLRCCLACVLPCGALDVIRIVHLRGRVEEISHPITAGEVLRAHPNHILSKLCSQEAARRILILSPEVELKRGSIYFLIPAASLPEKKRTTSTDVKKSSKKTKSTAGIRNVCDRYSTEAISEKKSLRRDRRTGRVEIWRPHLQSISED